MPRGRPPKISPEIVAKIAKAIVAGAYKETASAIVDVHRDTLNEWLRRGAKEKERVKRDTQKGLRGVRIRAPERLYVELSDAVEKAIARADVRDLGYVDEAARGGRKEVVTVTRTKAQPMIDHRTGKPIVRKDGVPIMITETTTETRESRAAPEWQAAAWKLERRNPRLYGRRTYAEITGRDGQDLIPLTAIRAAMAASEEIPYAEWEEIEQPAGLLNAGEDPMTPAPDLPEGEPPA